MVHSAILSADRLHLQHGPIDLVIGVDGARKPAFKAAEARVGSILAELMDEIDLLRLSKGPPPKGDTARKMWRAAKAHTGFVTPMAGVAGAVAETVLEAMQDASEMTRAYVNNGGDIALHLQGDANFSVAMSGLSGQGLGQISIEADSPVRGIATSGRGGRSLSMGIADSVSVLAKSASQADVAATLIANAVDLPDHPAIRRAPAHQLREDSDLGARKVVVEVKQLDDADREIALARGVAVAKTMQENELLHSASLHLQGFSQQIDMKSQKVLHHA